MCRRTPRPSAIRHPLSASSVSGFTLIEILVVIVIVGVIVSAATLSMGVLGRDSEAEDQTRRLWAVLVQAREECELQGIDTGMFISGEGYEFLRFDQRQKRWVPIEDDQLFASRKLPEGLRFRMWLESRDVVLKPAAVDRSDVTEDKKWPPQVLVLSSGDIQPFELHIERDSEPAVWRLNALPDGDLRLERRRAAEPWETVAQTKPPEEKNIRSSLSDKKAKRQ